MQRQLICGLLAFCTTAGLAAVGQQAKAASPYVVDGVTLGKSMLLPRAYDCSPGEQMRQYTWCRLSRQERATHGGFTSTTSVVRGPGHSVAYVNREIKPAFFNDDDIEAEIKRLSSRFGPPVREMRLPQRDDIATAIIVLWGKLQLDELRGPAALRAGAGGLEPMLLVDHLGDIQQSRQLGLPVYRLSGGAGYLWSASNRSSGRGHLRFLAADPSALPGGAELPASAAAQPPVAAPKIEVADPARQERAQDASTIKQATGSIGTKDLRPFMAPQQAPTLSGGAPTPELSYSKDAPRISIAQKTRADADRARMVDAERIAAEEREKARLAWTRFEAERAADARARLTWTVVAAFFMLMAILALLRALQRREEPAGLPEPGPESEQAEDARIRACLEPGRAGIGAALMKLRSTWGPNTALAVQEPR